MVRLKVCMSRWRKGLWLGFNSKVVRLKELARVVSGAAAPLFQFQSGAVKRIKRVLKAAAFSGFNSKVVRLKVSAHPQSF